MSLGSESAEALLEAFRSHYHRFENSIREVMVNHSDSTVLARLGDDVDEYAALVHEVCR